MLLLETEHRDALAAYLATRPYKEVYGAMEVLMSLRTASEPDAVPAEPEGAAVVPAVQPGVGQLDPKHTLK